MNTAIDFDDGDPHLRGKPVTPFIPGLYVWERLLRKVRIGEKIRSDIDPQEAATLIITTLEGSLMMNRLETKEDPLSVARRHLEEHLEAKVRTRKSKPAVKL